MAITPQGIVANLASAGIGQALDGISKVIDSVKGHSPETAEQLQEIKAALDQNHTELLKAAIAADTQSGQMQTDVTKVEAANPSTFVAGWRPAVGWTCAIALFNNFILAPYAEWIAALAGHPVPFPHLDIASLMTLLIGLLGLGGMRTLEKVQGVATKGVQ